MSVGMHPSVSSQHALSSLVIGLLIWYTSRPGYHPARAFNDPQATEFSCYRGEPALLNQPIRPFALVGTEVAPLPESFEEFDPSTSRRGGERGDSEDAAFGDVGFPCPVLRHARQGGAGLRGSEAGLEILSSANDPPSGGRRREIGNEAHPASGVL